MAKHKRSKKRPQARHKKQQKSRHDKRKRLQRPNPRRRKTTKAKVPLSGAMRTAVRPLNLSYHEGAMSGVLKLLSAETLVDQLLEFPCDGFRRCTSHETPDPDRTEWCAEAMRAQGGCQLMEVAGTEL